MARVDYDRMAADYVEGRVLPPEGMEPWRAAIAPWVPGGVAGRSPVLDLGAGTGQFAAANRRVVRGRGGRRGAVGWDAGPGGTGAAASGGAVGSRGWASGCRWATGRARGPGCPPWCTISTTWSEPPASCAGWCGRADGCWCGRRFPGGWMRSPCTTGTSPAPPGPWSSAGGLPSVERRVGRLRRRLVPDRGPPAGRPGERDQPRRLPRQGPAPGRHRPGAAARRGVRRRAGRPRQRPSRPRPPRPRWWTGSTCWCCADPARPARRWAGPSAPGRGRRRPGRG